MPRRSGAGYSAGSPAVRGSSVCRMHGAGGGAPRGNRNALKHGDFTAETLAVKKQVHALARPGRKRSYNRYPPNCDAALAAFAISRERLSLACGFHSRKRPTQ
jgi:hypothetical protein